MDGIYQKRIVHDVAQHQKLRIALQLQPDAICSIRLDLKLRRQVTILQYHVGSVQALRMSRALVLLLAHHVLLPTEPTVSLLASGWRRKVARNPRSLDVVPVHVSGHKYMLWYELLHISMPFIQTMKDAYV